jgi:serine/threonine protein kinase
MLEYVDGGLLFDLCKMLGGLGERGGRFFMLQLLDAVSCMHKKGIVHRDLKIENILFDQDLNLKVADFGFAAFENINKLNDYCGTKTYMAPEIKRGKTYDGKQVDVFSLGVILFILVQGIFPFMEAKKDDYYYSLILQGELEKYWEKVGGYNVSL